MNWLVPVSKRSKIKLKPISRSLYKYKYIFFSPPTLFCFRIFYSRILSTKFMFTCECLQKYVEKITFRSCVCTRSSKRSVCIFTHHAYTTHSFLFSAKMFVCIFIFLFIFIFISTFTVFLLHLSFNNKLGYF